MDQTELAIIGGGPGGYAAAFHAAEQGLSVTLIDEHAALGGVCLREGCIPSKALLHVARVLDEAREGAGFGVLYEEPQLDLEALRDWKDHVVQRLSDGVAQLARRREVRVLRGRASFVDSATLKLEGDGDDLPEQLRFERAIVATGSVPVLPKALQVDDGRLWTSREALALEEIPGRLLVIGGGYVGLELGTVYATLGARVAVVEQEGQILPAVDPELVGPLARRLEEQLESVNLSTKVTAIEPEEAGLLVSFDGPGVPAQQLFDRVLLAVGRRPLTEGLGLEHTEVEIDDDGFVVVDGRQRTADERILAIGDVAGPPMLAHKANREGKIAAEVVAGNPAGFDPAAIPAVVFTDPAVAWCGLTEQQAEQRDIPIRKVRYPWVASGRAHTLNRTEGLTKLLFDPKTERILGFGIVGVGAGELIAEGVLAVEMGAVVADLASTIHAHPTLSETIGESAEAVYGLATHHHSRRRTKSD